MKQVIPFSKEIVFKHNIASITSISLEHEEKVYDGEVSGDFIIFGDYKRHNDTTEKELFKYRLPFTAILPENVIINTVKVDIEDFTYDQIEDDVIRVNVDFSLSYEEEEIIAKDEKLAEPKEEAEERSEIASIDEDTIAEIETFLKDKEEKQNPSEDIINPDLIADENEKVISETKESEEIKEVKADNDEYVIYHNHIVKESETIEQIVSLYDTNLETVKKYNEIDKIKAGDKIIIPEYIDE